MATSSGPGTETPTTAEDVSFELERFAWAGPERLEVGGRWSGLGRVQLGPAQLVVELKDHVVRLTALELAPPVVSDSGEWSAAFFWPERRPMTLGPARLEFADGLVVDLPQASSHRLRFRQRSGHARVRRTTSGAATPGAPPPGPRAGAFVPDPAGPPPEPTTAETDAAPAAAVAAGPADAVTAERSEADTVATATMDDATSADTPPTDETSDDTADAAAAATPTETPQPDATGPAPGDEADGPAAATVPEPPTDDTAGPAITETAAGPEAAADEPDASDADSTTGPGSGGADAATTDDVIAPTADAAESLAPVDETEPAESTTGAADDAWAPPDDQGAAPQPQTNGAGRPTEPSAPSLPAPAADEALAYHLAAVAAREEVVAVREELERAQEAVARAEGEAARAVRRRDEDAQRLRGELQTAQALANQALRRERDKAAQALAQMAMELEGERDALRAAHDEHERLEEARARVAAELKSRDADVRFLQEALRHAEQRTVEVEALRDELAAAQGAREAAHALELATLQSASDAAQAAEQRARERFEALRRSLKDALGDEASPPPAA